MQTTTNRVREKRFKPSPALYRFTYSALIGSQGEKCALCGKQPPEVKLEIDHVDGKRESWVLQRLSLKCVHCNRSKFLGRLDSRNGERENRNASWEAQRSVELGPVLELEMARLLGESVGGVTVIDAQNRLAKICGCDQQTVARFIDRETTPEGSLILSSRTVTDGRKKRTLQFLSFRSPKALEG